MNRYVILDWISPCYRTDSTKYTEFFIGYALIQCINQLYIATSFYPPPNDSYHQWLPMGTHAINILMESHHINLLICPQKVIVLQEGSWPTQAEKVLCLFCLETPAGPPHSHGFISSHWFSYAVLKYLNILNGRSIERAPFHEQQLRENLKRKKLIDKWLIGVIEGIAVYMMVFLTGVASNSSRYAGRAVRRTFSQS